MIDTRVGKWVSHLCTSPIVGCCVKALASSPDQQKLALALNNGCNTICDIRTGKILSYYALQHSDITQVCVEGFNQRLYIGQNRNLKFDY